jgi:hypothetical protein
MQGRREPVETAATVLMILARMGGSTRMAERHLPVWEARKFAKEMAGGQGSARTAPAAAAGAGLGFRSVKSRGLPATGAAGKHCYASN